MLPSAMPNGHDRDWIRFCSAVDAFRATHGCWPTRMRMDAGYIRNFQRDFFLPETWKKLQERIEIVESDKSFVAEDDDGHSYQYGQEPMPEHRADINASEWLGVDIDGPVSKQTQHF